MKKLSILIVITAFIANSAFALTDGEEKQFKQEISEIGNLKKSAMIVSNVATMILSCPGGAALSALAGAADTLPLFTASANTFLAGSTELTLSELNEDETFVSILFGGAISAVVDVILTTYDFVENGKIDDGYGDDYNEAFSNVRKTYFSTAETARRAFGESGYCIDKFDRLGIILGVK